MTESLKTGSSQKTDDLDRLRKLLLGEDQDRLHKLDRRITDLESRTDDVAEVLPGAMNRVIEDPVSGPKIEQPIVDTIRGAIKRDAESFAEALFPVLGPAIRRAVADALKSLVQRVNVALEHSFTIKGLRWRMEAARSGVPFGQIVLRDTMVYAVQEVFLIQRDSGLLLASVRRDETLALDEDAFSAMLTAIQAFMQDSLGMSTDQLLSSVELGDQTLWVINGPNAVLACVITGNPPLEVHDQMLETIETLHARFGDQFDQPPEQLTDEPGITAVMQKTLKEQAVEDAQGPAKSKNTLWWVGAGAVLLLLGWSAWNSYQANRLEHQVAALFDVEPGYLLTSHENKGGQMRFAGLRDPLAQLPETVLQSADVELENVSLTFRPYQSLEEEMVLRRLQAALNGDPSPSLEISEFNLDVQGELTSAQYAMLEGLPGTHPVIRSVNLAQTRLAAQEAEDLARRQLDAPGSVAIDSLDGNIVFSGSSTADWFAAASASAGAGMIGGWALDFTPLRATLVEQLDALQNRVNGRSIMFSRQSVIAPAMQGELDTLGAELAELQKLAEVLQTRLTIVLEGNADGIGTSEKNQTVALNRARTVRSELSGRGVDPTGMTMQMGRWQGGVEDSNQRKVVVQIQREPAN